MSRRIREPQLHSCHAGYTDYTWEYAPQEILLKYADQYRTSETNSLNQALWKPQRR